MKKLYKNFIEMRTFLALWFSQAFSGLGSAMTAYAITGKSVLEYIENSDKLIASTAAALKTNLLNEIDKKAEAVMTQSRELEKQIDGFKAKRYLF